MAATQTFSGVSPSTWACVKATSASQDRTTYNPPDADSGVATSPTPVGDVVLSFDYDPTAATVTYTIESKPAIVTEGEIWGGIQKMITSCSG